MPTIETPLMKYKYRTVSVKHIEELREDIEKLKQEDKLSHNKTFLSYINKRTFNLPEEMPNAKFIIVVASQTKLAQITFNNKNQKHPYFIPPPYYNNGVTSAMIKESLLKDVIKDPDQKLVCAKSLLLKITAVRSGLGKYGKNNICYVDEMGSFINLFCYFTEYEFPEDHWGELQLMEYCKTCNFCLINCPTNAIRENNFVIEAGNCVTLYNETEGDFPEWMDPSVHNAMMGCLRCQYKCPGNRCAAKDIDDLGEITAEETQMILDGKMPDDVLETVCDKLKILLPEEYDAILPIISRNLRVLLK